MKLRIKSEIKGFTLVELLVVMGIIAVIASGLVIAINPFDKVARANDAKVQNDISQISVALAAFVASNNGYYPCTVVAGCSVVTQTSGGLQALVDNGDLPMVPEPPSGYTPYVYNVDSADAPIQAVVYTDLKANKYNATPYWKWCSFTAKAGPTANAADFVTCP